VQNRIIERDEEMIDLQPGDQIDIVFADAPGHSARATVTRLLSDQQEGLSSEAEDYVFCWMEISPEHQGILAQTQTITLGADWKYYMDGREVEIRKCSKPAS
jgi:protein involved in polysaccharide export with SLBB domain